jgi:hypothetical protein
MPRDIGVTSTRHTSLGGYEGKESLGCEAVGGAHPIPLSGCEEAPSEMGGCTFAPSKIRPLVAEPALLSLPRGFKWRCRSPVRTSVRCAILDGIFRDNDTVLLWHRH